jgi:hypothetical protein
MEFLLSRIPGLLEAADLLDASLAVLDLKLKTQIF